MNTKLKKLGTSFLLCMVIVMGVLMFKLSMDQSVVSAATQTDYLNTIEQKTQLPTFDKNTHAKASYQAGASNITSAVYFVLDFFKFLVGGVAIMVIIVAAIKLIMARKKIDDVWPKQKEHLIMVAFAFVVIMIADVLIKKVFFGTEGEVFESQAQAQLAAQEGTKQLKGIYNAAMLIVGTLAILMLIIAGLRLLASGGNEEAQTKVKKQITWIVLGIFLIGIAEFVVMDVIFPDQGSKIPDAEKAKMLIKDFTNFVSAFVAIISIVMFIYGGTLYISAFGNDEKTGKAKKVFIGAIIGIILAAGAFAIVNTLITFEPGA